MAGRFVVHLRHEVKSEGAEDLAPMAIFNRMISHLALTQRVMETSP